MMIFRFLIMSFVFLVVVPDMAWAVDDAPATTNEIEQAVVDPAPQEKEETPSRPKNVPIVTFRQKVDSVVAVQQHPNVLKATVEQDENIITADLVISNNQNRPQAKALAEQFIRIIKKKTLDDEPSEKEIGKGLYTYKINVSRANKATLATGIKRFNEKKIQWAINDEGAKDGSMLSGEMPQ